MNVGTESDPLHLLPSQTYPANVAPCTPLVRSLEATEALYRDHFAFVWTNLRRLGVPRPYLEDAAQDVFIVVHRRRATFDGKSTRGWLFGIVRRIAAHYRRTGKRQARKNEALRLVVEAEPKPDDATRAELRQLLDRFLASLDDAKRTIFILVDLEDVAVQDAAHLLAINVNTAHARVRSARMALGEFLRTHGSLGDIVEHGRSHEPPERAVVNRAWLAILPRLDESTSASLSSASTTSTMGITGKLAIGILSAGLLVGTATVVAADNDPREASTVPDSGVLAAGLSIQPTVDPDHVVPDQAVRPSMNHVIGTTPPASGVPHIVNFNFTPAAVITLEPMMASNDRVELSGTGSTAKQPAKTRPAAAHLGTHKSSIAREATLMTEARARLRGGSAQNALELVDGYMRSYPNGSFTNEAKLLRIAALCGAGQRSLARDEAQAFARAHPDSPLADRARGACRQGAKDTPFPMTPADPFAAP